MRRFRLAGLLAGFGLVLSAAASAQVTNGGFETGDFGGWTQFDNVSFTSVVNGNFIGFDPVEGSYHAVFGPVGSTGGISQVLSLTAGSQYTVSFWLGNYGLTHNSISVDFDGNNLLGLTDDPGFAYTSFSYSVTASVANPTLSFTMQHDSAYWVLDDVRVTLVPEPAALSLLAVAGLFIRRR